MKAHCEVRRQLAEAFAIAARLYAEIAVNLAVSGISQNIANKRHRLKRGAGAGERTTRDRAPCPCLQLVKTHNVESPNGSLQVAVSKTLRPRAFRVFPKFVCRSVSDTALGLNRPIMMPARVGAVV